MNEPTTNGTTGQHDEPWWEHAHPAFPDEPGLSEEDERWYVEHVSKRYSDPAELKPGNLADLAGSIAGYLTGLGLEPEVRDESIRFLFLGRVILLTLEDIDTRLEALAAETDGRRSQVSDDERGMMAAGLPVG
jgi:hypothetical protein